ncbi:phosrestin-2-like isoform X2 [Ornithodoros turicata]|uniref:phosrestin-2-like isoform X2 n=1 Tax=Ornithodoros turicata TaxID=34597 RepID=UPI003138F35F
MLSPDVCCDIPASFVQKVTVYLEKKEFCDLGTCTEQVEGVVTLDRSQLESSERLLVALVGRFRYGREEDEILGMSLCREIYLGHAQLCPGDGSKTPGEPGTSYGRSSRRIYAIQRGAVHERLLAALGEDAIPFRFEFPTDAPVSTVMQRLTPESGDTCGVRYYVRCYTTMEVDEKPPPQSCVNLPIRKAQFANIPKPLPSSPRTSSVCKDFALNGGKVVLEASLKKDVYCHGEDIVVNVKVQNDSHKTIKHVKASILQVADICMFSTGRWKVSVAATSNRGDSPIQAGTTFETEVRLKPMLEENRNKYGVFVQSYNGQEPDCLASSTILSEQAKKNIFGIVVSYEVKVKLCLGTLSTLSGRGEVACFVPFLLMHPEPAELPNPVIREETEEILTVHRAPTPPPSTSSPLPLTNGIGMSDTEPVGIISPPPNAEGSTDSESPPDSAAMTLDDDLDPDFTLTESPAGRPGSLSDPEVIQKLSDLNVSGVPLID